MYHKNIEPHLNLNYKQMGDNTDARFFSFMRRKKKTICLQNYHPLNVIVSLYYVVFFGAIFI